MEKLVNCDILIDIEIIDRISGGNEEFDIYFTSKDNEKHIISFDSVWDLRYSIENASIDRFYQLRKNLSSGIINNSIYIIENSKYIEYFETQLSGTRTTDKINHYVLYDRVDTTLDILTLGEPTLSKQ